MRLQSLIRAIYPAQCVACEAQTAEDHGLCALCWSETHFIHGLVCDDCGVPLMGEDTGGDGDETLLCDECLTHPRPWDRGRAALVYEGVGRRMVLGLKHGDRTDLVVPAGKWLAQAARPLLTPQTVIVPVPLHWSRMLKRRFNQAALLSAELARLTRMPHVPDALRRTQSTHALDGHSRAARFDTLNGVIASHPGRLRLIRGHDLLLVDDVMTTGATFAACTEALRAAGAEKVNVLALARVARDF